MPKSTGGLERAIADMTIGVELHRQKREKQLKHTSGKEMEQQIRVPVAGEASNGWGFSDRGVGFLLPFIWLPAQRGAPFKTPHFSYGIEHLSGTGELVIINAAVVKWKIDQSSRVTGARIRYASSAPMMAEGEMAEFSAVAHLTFQGFACETEEGEV